MDDMAKSLAFVIKHSTRPNINVDHEEVNMYNFWTKIPKRVIYEPMTMRFYDDNKGLAHLFYTTYLRHISPITRNNNSNVKWMQANSMNFNRADIVSTASLSALEGENVSIIKEIKLFHIYDWGRKMNVYNFYNPKITNIVFDELEMASSGDGNEIEMQFVYDGMYITPALDMQENEDLVKSITGGDNVFYPIKPNYRTNDDTQKEENGTIEGEPPLPSIQNVFEGIAANVSGAISSATGLVSNAFDKVNDFAGSVFR